MATTSERLSVPGMPGYLVDEDGVWRQDKGKVRPVPVDAKGYCLLVLRPAGGGAKSHVCRHSDLLKEAKAVVLKSPAPAAPAAPVEPEPAEG